MKYTDIEFPIFIIGNRSVKIDIIDNIVYVNKKIVDNPNLDYSTLAERRFNIPSVYKLSSSIPDYETLVRYKYKSNKTYIDNHGNIFWYKPANSCVSNSYAITRTAKKGNITALFVDEIEYPHYVRTAEIYNKVLGELWLRIATLEKGTVLLDIEDSFRRQSVVRV